MKIKKKCYKYLIIYFNFSLGTIILPETYFNTKRIYVLNRVRNEIGCEEVISSRYNGKNVGIAVLDTGISVHDDLKSRVISFVDFINGENKMYDDNGHGTHISGIIAGNGHCSNGMYRGIAPSCNVISLKVLDNKGDGNTKDVLRALEYVIDNKERLGIRIVNISIGSIPNARSGERTKLIQGVERAWDEGLCVIVAAGNNGPNPMTVTTPGISRKVITVGACESYNGNENVPAKKNFSGRGPTPYCIVKPEVVAPGINVKSCLNDRTDYTVKSGSSMATAVVSGCIALLMEKYPRITNSKIKLRLYERCIDLNLPKNQQGWGMIHLPELLR